MGVGCIGGCCGFEPYHIRAIAEEVGLIYIYILYSINHHSPVEMLSLLTTSFSYLLNTFATQKNHDNNKHNKLEMG